MKISNKLPLLIKKFKIPPNQYLKLISLAFILGGICLMPAGFIHYGINEEAHLSGARFARLLLTVKKRCEIDFNIILKSVEENPLDDLLKEKLPTAEEIFFSEWANDWFPTIEVPVVGSIVEEIGAEMVGDVNLDNRAPSADLNISTHSNPSSLTIKQCRSLWNRNNDYSLVSIFPRIWFRSISGDNSSRYSLQLYHNLTNVQYEFISSWIQKSLNTWVLNIDYLDVFEHLNYGFLGMGFVFFLVGLILFRNERKKIDSSQFKKQK